RVACQNEGSACRPRRLSRQGTLPAPYDRNRVVHRHVTTVVDVTLVNVVFRKYDGSLHWNYQATRLGEDEHGVWLGAPLGTELRRGEAVMELAEMAHVVLLPRAGWWT